MYSPDSIRDSTYEGWVAWIDGTPVINPATNGLIGYDGVTALFERVDDNPLLSAIATELDHLAPTPKRPDRQTVDWAQLPHARVCQLELYAFRSAYKKQPLVSITRNHNHQVRWIQYKRGGLLINSASVVGKDKDLIEPKVRRTGVTAYVIGYWDMTAGEAKYWEVPASGNGGNRFPGYEYEGRNHPCWPRPHGFGFNPKVLGLKPEQVPPVPESFLQLT